MSLLHVKLSSGSLAHLNKTQILSLVHEAFSSGLPSLSKLSVGLSGALAPPCPEHPAVTPSALPVLCPPPGTPCHQIQLLRAPRKASPPRHLLSRYPLPGSVVLVSLPDIVWFRRSFPGSLTTPPDPCTRRSWGWRWGGKSLGLCLACSQCSKKYLFGEGWINVMLGLEKQIGAIVWCILYIYRRKTSKRKARDVQKGSGVGCLMRGCLENLSWEAPEMHFICTSVCGIHGFA